MDRRIENLKRLGLTDEEVAEVLETDRRIDKGEKLFDLPPDLADGAKKARNAGNCSGYTKTAKERKADLDKGKLIADLIDGIPYADNFEITNPEREFLFTYKGRKFKVVLSAPRK